MEFSDVVDAPAPTRFSIAGGFALAVVLASMMHAPADPFAELGPLGLFTFDKWIHVGSYALVALLLSYAYLARTVTVLAGIAVLTVALGVGVEFIQGTISWRTMELADVAANSTGALVALGVWRVAWDRLPVQVASNTDR